MAASWLPTGPAQIPIGTEPVDGTPYDFRTPRSIGPLHVEIRFTDLELDERGRATVTLSAPGGGRTVALWLDEHHPYVEVFAGDTLPDRQRGSLGFEPMTCPPDAFCTGERIQRLRPGQRTTTAWGITVT